MSNTETIQRPARVRLNSIFVKIAGLFAAAAIALTGFMILEAARSTARVVVVEILEAGRQVNALATGNIAGAIRFADAAPIEEQILGLTKVARRTRPTGWPSTPPVR
jgi:hypothetical protein